MDPGFLRDDEGAGGEPTGGASPSRDCVTDARNDGEAGQQRLALCRPEIASLALAMLAPRCTVRHVGC